MCSYLWSRVRWFRCSLSRSVMVLVKTHGHKRQTYTWNIDQFLSRWIPAPARMEGVWYNQIIAKLLVVFMDTAIFGAQCWSPDSNWCSFGEWGDCAFGPHPWPPSVLLPHPAPTLPAPWELMTKAGWQLVSSSALLGYWQPLWSVILVILRSSPFVPTPVFLFTSLYHRSLCPWSILLSYFRLLTH